MDDASIYEVLHGHNPATFSEAANERLWERIPARMRLVHFTRSTVPAEHIASFGYYHAKIGDIHLDRLPVAMQRELAFAIWRIVEMGGKVSCAAFGLLARELAETTERLCRRGGDHRTLMACTPVEWHKELAHTWVARKGSMPNRETFRTYLGALDRACKLVWFAYDEGPWWTREIWDLSLDPRIPRREHEPIGERAIHWHRIEPRWLRQAAMWHIKVALETNRMTWSTVLIRCGAMLHFAAFLARRGIDSPELVRDHSELRPLMIGYLDELRSAPTSRGARRSHASLFHLTTAVRSFYAFMHDNRADAARILNEPRWERLGAEHLRFWQSSDLPRRQGRQSFDERHLITDATAAKILAHVHHLANPRDEGGFGDPQAMRLMLLLILTGRRLSELRMLDASPLVGMIEGSETEGGGEQLAKLRYQQTKIAGAPDTIFVDGEVVAIIREQQRWLAERRAAVGATGAPRYLFTKQQNSIPGDHPYAAVRLRQQLVRLAKRYDLRDEHGEIVRLGQTHRWRHTKATSLINAGVPLHVVQRYMGHISPAMTMHYAQTLDATAKAEFLRYQKITHTGASTAVAASDLYDLMALETRTDRVLPNGWCALPPAQSCDKGNACLTCNVFVTDTRFRSIHEEELRALEALIASRQVQHEARTGQEMSETHVWLEQRRREQAALKDIIAAIDSGGDAGEPLQAAGVPTRVTLDLERHKAKR